ncbi:MAG TPA: hypothetical protein DEQ61_09450 [Streptomyces sp.]|nr:hypothetical protein [Streptomyces sp.]
MSGIRQARESDHSVLVECVRSWWDDSRSAEEARELSLLLPKLFLQHFARTSLLAEGPDGAVHGFLVGFHSGDRPDESYIHFTGVHPGHRRQGIARELYERFFALARAAGRHQVLAVTAPGNRGSVGFHRALGFEPEPGDAEAGGVPYVTDDDGPGRSRVRLRRRLGTDAGTASPFTVRISVRGYETDSQGHLNSSVYTQYAEHARWSLLQTAGIRQSDLLDKGVGPVNLESTTRFRRELRAGDEVDVGCVFVRSGGKTFRIEQSFHRAGELVAELNSVSGLMDLAERRLLADPRPAFRAMTPDPRLLGL